MGVSPIFATYIAELTSACANHVDTPLFLAHRSLTPLAVLIPLSNFEKDRFIISTVSLMNRKDTFGAKRIAAVVAGQNILIDLPENSITVVVGA